MSDFVDWQITRAVAGPRLAIRPRLPSLFEPPAMEGTGAPDETLAETEREVEARPWGGAVASPAPRAPAGAPPGRAGRGEMGATIEEEVEVDAGDASARASLDSAVSPMAVRPGQLDPAAGREPVSPGRDAAPDVRRLIAPAPVARLARAATASALPHDNPEDDGGDARSEAPARRPQAGVEPAMAANPVAVAGPGLARGLAARIRRLDGGDGAGAPLADGEAPVPLLRAPPGMPAPAAPAGRRAQTMAADPFARPRAAARARAAAAAGALAWAGAADADPEPTIEVTIGRIEVRAASSAAPAAPARPAPRKPSELEVYLEKKGARRP